MSSPNNVAIIKIKIKHKYRTRFVVVWMHASPSLFLLKLIIWKINHSEKGDEGIHLRDRIYSSVSANVSLAVSLSQ